MKKYILTILISTCFIFIARAQDLSSMWDRANTLYINADFQNAIATYDSILYTGNVSHKLYYNMGNAYFKAGNMGKSILFYNKALRLYPSDVDTKHNLLVANSRIKDKIEHVPEFFITQWIRIVYKGLSSNTWTIISLVMFALSLTATLFYLLSAKTVARKAGFWTAAISILFTIATISFASIQYREAINPSSAIVMNSSVAIKSSPDRSSQDLFIIHEGTKVNIISSLEQWREVVIADGNKGWLEVSNIELID